MDLTVLRIFVDVMRHGSFALVARGRNLAPSSISRAIAGLEAELGVRLFQRTTRRLSPTEAARAYFEQLDRMIEDLEGAAHLARDAGKRPRGTLRINAPISFAQVNLMPILPEFARRYPDLMFDLELTDAVLDLVEGRFDVAVRLGRLAESSLIAHRLCEMVSVVCASPGYLRQSGKPKTPQELEHHQTLRYPVPSTPARWRFQDSKGRLFEVPVVGRVTVANGLVLQQCALAGMGLTLLPRWNVAAALRNGSLVDVFPEYAVTATGFDVAAWVLYPSREYLPAKVRVFVDFLKEQFAVGAPAEREPPGLVEVGVKRRPRTARSH